MRVHPGRLTGFIGALVFAAVFAGGLSGAAARAEVAVVYSARTSSGSLDDASLKALARERGSVEVWARTENGTRTTSWTCPGPTSSTSDSWSGTYNNGPWVTTSNTCVATPPPNNGVCPSRRMTIGCATFDVSTRTRVTPVSIGEDNGAVFSTPGQYVRCTLGYTDAIGADGFPSIEGDQSRYRLSERGGCGMTDWESEYGVPEECSSYVRVFARNADGTNGQMCFGEAKITFNWDGR